jgi:hypothetical protein
MNSALRVQKASKSAKIEKQVSLSGSIEKKRFSGWIEQELGKAAPDKRVSTGAAREGNYANTLKAKYRLKPGRNRKTAADFRTKKHKTYGQAVVSMIESARSGKTKQPFIIQKGGGPGRLKNYKYGLYAEQGGEINRIQNFEKRWKPKKTPWMEISLKKFDKSFDLKQAWAKELTFRLKKIGGR